MPDIAMCACDSCPKAKECWRHEAPPSPYRQAYGDFAPDEKGECRYFWQMERGLTITDKQQHP